MTEHDGTMDWRQRPATLDDASAATGMFNARSRHFYGVDQASEDQIRAWMGSTQLDLERDTRLITDEKGRILAWANLNDPGDPCVSITFGLSVAVGFMGNPALWDTLLAWCERRAREVVPRAPSGARVVMAFQGLVEDEHRWAAVERAGGVRVRISNRMRVDLEPNDPQPTSPDGIDWRCADIDDDLEPLAAAVEEAFRDQWGHIERSPDAMLHEWRTSIAMSGDRFDPSLWFLAVDRSTGEIAGFALCEPDIAGDATLGYVDTLGVRRRWRKRGLGLALLHHAFAELGRRGCVAVELDTDSESLTGALRLYEKAGMRVIRRQASYEKVLRSGRDLAVRELERSAGA